MGCSPNPPPWPPVPECPAGPLLGGLREPRWDPPLRSDPASAAAARFEPAEGGGALGHALPRPREWTPRVGGRPRPVQKPRVSRGGKARSGTYPPELGSYLATSALQALAQAPCTSCWPRAGKQRLQKPGLPLFSHLALPVWGEMAS